VTRALHLAAALLLAAGLAACVHTIDGVVGTKTSDKDAAHANVQLGVAYMQQGQMALAKEKLERAAKQAPNSVEVHTSLAFLYERLDHPAQAEAEYERALRISPGNSDVANNYAVYLCRTGKVDKALKNFDMAAKDRLYSTPWAALTNAAVCLRSVQRAPEAVNYLERALQQRPNYSNAVFELADLQLELGSPGVAGQVVDRYLAMGIASPDVLLVGVRAALARDDRPAAQVYARRLRRDFAESVQTKALPQLLGDRG
jgi:type IV pilus assembly protein PilF